MVTSFGFTSLLTILFLKVEITDEWSDDRYREEIIRKNSGNLIGCDFAGLKGCVIIWSLNFIERSWLCMVRSMTCRIILMLER